MRTGSLVICLLTFVCPTIGQVTVPHNVAFALSRWAVNGGATEAANDWNSEQSPMPGLFFEIPVEIPVFRKFRLISGLGFIQKGFQWKESHELYRVGFLQLPLLVGVRLGSSRFHFTPSLGATLSKNMGGARRFDIGVLDLRAYTPIGRPDDIGYPYRMPDCEWALQGRLSVDYQLKRSRIGLVVGYQHGVSNMMINYIPPYADFDNPEGIPDPTIPDRAFQRSMTISLGYVLEVGRRSSSTAARDTTREAVKAAPRRFSIGQRAGVSYASIVYTASLPEEQDRVNSDSEPLKGLASALVVNIRLNDRFSLQPELAYTQRGWRSQWYPRPSIKNDVLRMNYLELPVLVRYSPFAGKWQPFVLVGPVVGRGVGGFDIATIDSPVFGEYSFPWQMTFGDDPESQYELYDIALLAGAGVLYRTKRTEVFVDLRYQSSVTDFVPAGNMVQYSDDITAKHRVWLLSVGYLIPW